MTSGPTEGTGWNTERPISLDGRKRPAVLIFDVNETLSDMSSMRRRFEEVGVPAHLAATWFAGLLRDGFALTAAGASEPFGRIAAEALRVSLHDAPLNRTTDDAVKHIMEGFAGLSVHGDVPQGIDALRASGLRLVTLSNGSTSVAEALFDRAGIRRHFEALLSVENAGAWKPAQLAYDYALEQVRDSARGRHACSRPPVGHPRRGSCRLGYGLDRPIRWPLPCVLHAAGHQPQVLDRPCGPPQLKLRPAHPAHSGRHRSGCRLERWGAGRSGSVWTKWMK